MNRLSTVKTKGEGSFRDGRCDEDGYQEVKIVGGGGAGSTETAIDQSTPGTTNLVVTTQLPVSPVNISGTITTGGIAQVLAAANPNRRGWWIRNNSTGSLWVSDMTTAVQSQPSLEIKAGELYEALAGGVSFNALSIIGATTGQAWTGREW